MRKSWLGVFSLILAVFLLVAANRVRAVFVLEKSVKNNLIRTGQIAFDLSPAESWLSSDNLLPGQSIANTFTINNVGSSNFVAKISLKKSAGYSNLFESLQLTIKQQDELIYSGPANELQNIPLIADSLAPTNSRQFSLEVKLPPETTSALDNTYTNLTFVIAAEQRI